MEIELDPERFVTRSHGRRAWFREARRGLDEQREQAGAPYCALPSRAARESRRAGWRRSSRSSTWQTRPTRRGASAGSPRTVRAGWRPARPSPTVRRTRQRGAINTTDPDSRLVKTVGQRALQGYNAQAAVNEHQIIVAAEVTVDSPDFGHLEPMVDATQRELVDAVWRDESAARPGALRTNDYRFISERGPRRVPHLQGREDSLVRQGAVNNDGPGT